jgi:ABC-type thiamine transport system substrate-binding protein
MTMKILLKLGTYWVAGCMVFGALGAGSESQSPKLRIYVYDSLAGQGSFMEALEQEFKLLYPQVKLEIKALGESGRMLSQLALDTRSQDQSVQLPDLVVGLDSLHWMQAKPFADFLVRRCLL